MTHPTPRDDWPDPTRLIRLVALVATHGLLRLAERYLPAFFSALGYGSILIGLVTSLGLAVAAVATTRSSGLARGASGSDSPILPALATATTALGLLAWAGAPALDALLGTPLSTLGWLAVGVVLVQAWHVRGPVRRLWPVDTGIVGETASESTRRPTVVGALGVGAGAVVATAAVSSATGVRAGFPLLAAAGAAVALVASVAPGTGDRSTALGPPSDDAAASTADTETIPSLESVRRAVAALPDRRTCPVVGDALVRAAVIGVAPYLILLFVDYRPVALSARGIALEPAALFGLFVLAEALGASVGAVAAPALDSRLDRRWLLAGGLAAVSLFPMAFVAAPASAGVVALLFALFGCRTVIEPLRPTVGSIARTAPDSTPNPTRSTLETVRAGVRLALVPAPLLGGLLYAVSPVAAFTLATTVGLLGVRELLRPLEFDATN